MSEFECESNNFKIYTIIYLLTQIKNIFTQLLPLFKFIFITVFKFKMYVFINKETRNKLDCFIEDQKDKYLCFEYNDDAKPYGFIIHKNIFPKYILNNNTITDNTYIFCSDDIYKKIININSETKFKKINIDEIENKEKLYKLTKTDHVNSDNDSDSDTENSDDEEGNDINYLYKSNAEYSGYNRYSCRIIKVPNNNSFNHTQNELFKEIMEFYNKNKYAKVFISGDINTGKSYFSYILARKLNCYLCDSFDPTEPAEDISNLYSSKKLLGNKPLIILIDEVDIMIKNIHKNEIPKHKYYPIPIRDKPTWNSFLDKIDYGLYPNLILIMTSNSKKRDIDSLDTSYLREGRINIFKVFNDTKF